jgi:hypothetical protein
MAGHGKLITVPADPGYRCSGVRGFLLQVSRKDIRITQWGGSTDYRRDIVSTNPLL